MIILGNKSDCNAIREVNADVAGQWARSRGIRPYEVTVINRDSLKDPFCYIAWRMANPGELCLANSIGMDKTPTPRHVCMGVCCGSAADLFKECGVVFLNP